jgi:hypothetical protein
MAKHKFISITLALAALLFCPLTSFAHDFGLADISGKILLPPVYQGASYVSENCFHVTPKGDPQTVILFVNQSGETIPKPPGAELYDHEGLLAPAPIVPRNKGAAALFVIYAIYLHSLSFVEFDLNGFRGWRGIASFPFCSTIAGYWCNVDGSVSNSRLAS